MQRLTCVLSRAFKVQQGDVLASLQLIYSGGKSTRASTSRVQLRAHSSKQKPEQTVVNGGKSLRGHARNRLDEHGEKRAARALQLDSFFSSKSPNAPTAPNADNEALLEHCNQAIVLSRTSSDIKTFDIVRHQLRKAAKLFYIITQAHRDYGVEPDMAYEIFLLRSSWLQVVRSILALAKGDAVRICSSMMTDYLNWEFALLQSGLRIKDGTEKIPQLPPDEILSPKAKEIMIEQYFHGPFVQDAAPVLHELFTFMTLGNPGAIERAIKHRKTYQIQRNYKQNCQSVGITLWEAVSQIKASHWRKPLSSEWLRICDRTEYKSGQELIASCMLMHAEALYGNVGRRSMSRMDQSLSVWRNSLSLCSEGCEFYLRKLMRLCLKVIQQAGRELSLSPKEETKRAQDYFQALLGLAEALNTTFLKGDRDQESIGKQDLETALRLVLASEGMFRQRSRLMDEQSRQVIKGMVSRTSSLSTGWILTWLKDASLDIMPRFASTTTYNRILERLCHSKLPSNTVNSLTLSLLQKLASDPALPSPNESTISVVIRLAKQSGLQEMVNTATLLAQCRLQAKGDMNVYDKDQINAAPTQADVDKSSSAPKLKPILSLVDDALKRGDVYRLQSLIASTAIRHSPTVSDNNISVGHGHAFLRAILFHLYPSLDVRRRRIATFQGKDRKAISRDDQSNSTAFQPRVLATVFHHIVGAGLTGLGERVWRLIKRCHLRAAKNIQWKKLNIAVYTTLMRLYQNEVHFGSRLLRQRQSGRILSAVNRPRKGNSLRQRLDRQEMDVLPRGWGYIISGPGASRLQKHEKPNRVVLARAIAKVEYQHMKLKWLQGTAEKPDALFWKFFLSIFRKGGKLNEEFEISNEADMTFLLSVKEDMDDSDRHMCIIPNVHNVS